MMQLLLRHAGDQLRRLLSLAVGLLLMLMLGPASAAPSNGPIRIGFPEILFSTQYLLIAEWRQYLGSKLNRPVEIVLNKKFSNSIVQFYIEKLDFSWVTDYPDIHLKDQIHLLAVPLYKGQPYFTTYLIVPAYNDKTTSLLQLKGALFAFSNQSQNGGYLDVHHELLTAGEDPTRFFSRVIFTGSQRDVIKAVALGLAQAGAVDGLVWDSLAKARPDLAAQTRIVTKSHPYGAPPIIGNHFVSPENLKAMQQVLVGMTTDPKGLELLSRMGLNGFVAGDDRIYERTIKMRQLLNGE